MLGAAAAPPPAPPPPALVHPTHAIETGVRYGFDKAVLGMSLEDWRALSIRQLRAVCSPERERRVICSTEDVPLGGPYAAHNLSYTFLGGKLARIAFETSINGYDNAVAVLIHSFGQPTQISRDTIALTDGAVFPHVLMTWRAPRAAIALSDPEPNGRMLSVQIGLDVAGPQGGRAEVGPHIGG